MNKKQVEELKENLLKMKQEIINGGQLTRKDDLHVQPEDLPDDADLASNIINQQVTFSMRNRELAKLRSIEEALDKIENGAYGTCEECDEPIGFKRLKNQPFTSLCITHAEEYEREQNQHFKRVS